MASYAGIEQHLRGLDQALVVPAQARRRFPLRGNAEVAPQPAECPLHHPGVCAANHRATQRKARRTADDEAALTRDIIALAKQYDRYGYRRITASYAGNWVMAE